jgi:hypothetical protein
MGVRNISLISSTHSILQSQSPLFPARPITSKPEPRLETVLGQCQLYHYTAVRFFLIKHERAVIRQSFNNSSVLDIHTFTPSRGCVV